MSKSRKRQQWRDDRLEKCQLTPKTEKQRQYMSAIRANETTIAIGPAGTGKSYVSIILALEEMQKGNIKKIVISRPLISVGQSSGLLPGTLEDKLEPWLKPITETIISKMGMGWYETARRNGKIEVAAFETMQGRSFENTFIILDEAQNCSEFEIKMFLTRLGYGCKTVIEGDLVQKSLGAKSGLGTLVHMIRKYNLPVPVIQFSLQDIVRSDQCFMWLCAYESMNQGMDEMIRAYDDRRIGRGLRIVK